MCLSSKQEMLAGHWNPLGVLNFEASTNGGKEEEEKDNFDED